MHEPLVVATIRWGSAGPLLVTSLAIMGSPGPATISLTAAGSAYGVIRSLPYLVGIICGTTIVLVAVATGITSTLLVLPALRTVLLAISAAYILWLAYHVATAPPLLPRTYDFALGVRPFGPRLPTPARSRPPSPMCKRCKLPRVASCR